jgi:uncharacterized membrane protein (UPF0127 family)
VSAQQKCILNLTRGTVTCERALIADQPLRRMRGLLGRSSLPVGEGLLLRPAPSVHTALMRFPIDIVFLDKHLHVLKLVERLVPWRAASAPRARAALELAGGEIARRGVEIGDALEIVDARVGLEVLAEDPRALHGATGAQDRPRSSNGATRPVRVLLITSDRRFRVLAAALLTQRGCSVTLAERMKGVAARATHEASDVVVLDATTSVTAAAREAADVGALEPGVGVVIVAEETAERIATTLVLPKWESFDRLYGAIEAAHDRHGLGCC